MERKKQNSSLAFVAFVAMFMLVSWAIIQRINRGGPAFTSPDGGGYRGDRGK